jgi:hypothetical protein
MKTYKVKIWEKVSVWQEVGVVIEAESEKELDALFVSGEFSKNILDCENISTEWSTEEHLEYDTTKYRILSEKENQ